MLRHFVCPIKQDVVVEPVITVYGQVRQVPHGGPHVRPMPLFLGAVGVKCMHLCRREPTELTVPTVIQHTALCSALACCRPSTTPDLDS